MDSTEEPVMEEMECLSCERRWIGMWPQGREGHRAECPSCGKMAGLPIKP
jgi:hypothetical protein